MEKTVSLKWSSHVYSDCGCHLMRHALVCMTAYYLLAVIGLYGGGEVLSALGPFHFHVSPRCWRWFCVWLWVLGLCLVCVLLLWLFLCCCVSVFACAPYAPSYISYDDSSHSEWALDFLLGRSTSGVARFIPS